MTSTWPSASSLSIEVRPAKITERQIMRNLLELYQHDFSEFDGMELNDHGHYVDLDCFWLNPAWVAYVIKADDKWAGFALINDEVQIAGNSRAIVEFFIVRKYRRLGVGRDAALAIMRALPAKWEIRVIESNRAAQDFWNKLANSH